MALQVGDRAPELLGLNEKGEEIRLDMFKGKKVVILEIITKNCARQVMR